MRRIGSMPLGRLDIRPCGVGLVTRPTERSPRGSLNFLLAQAVGGLFASVNVGGRVSPAGIASEADSRPRRECLPNCQKGKVCVAAHTDVPTGMAARNVTC